MSDTLFIVIPAYNEQAVIRETVEQWYPLLSKADVGRGSRLVIVDDGSTDDTYRILQELTAIYPQLDVRTQANSGHGATVLHAYRYALEQGADYVFQTDSDGQTRPEEFASLWSKRDDYDMLIGQRIHREDGISRIMVTRILKNVIRLRFGVTIEDANTPFRLMKAKRLSKALPLIPDDFNLSNVVLCAIYAKAGWSIHFEPISFRPRQGGKNSINLKAITGIGKHALHDFSSINTEIDKAVKAGDLF